MHEWLNMFKNINITRKNKQVDFYLFSFFGGGFLVKSNNKNKIQQIKLK